MDQQRKSEINEVLVPIIHGAMAGEFKGNNWMAQPGYHHAAVGINEIAIKATLVAFEQLARQFEACRHDPVHMNRALEVMIMDTKKELLKGHPFFDLAGTPDDVDSPE